MSEPNDKPLHDWVRQTLHDYQPEYNPQDWERMQGRLHRLHGWRGGAIGLTVLLLTGMVTWWVLTDRKMESPVKVSVEPKNQLPSQRNPSLSDTIANRPAFSPSLRPLPKQELVTHDPSLPTKKAYYSVPDILEARKNLHLPANNIEGTEPKSLEMAMSAEERAIQQQLLTGEFGPDSTSYRVLARNLRRWPNAVIVCDLTTSMYPYSTQLFAWFKQNAQHAAVQGIVFFTDCDSLGRETNPAQPNGQMFWTRSTDVRTALPVMRAATRNTVHNDEAAENDIEALLFAQKNFPEARHLILVADNSNPVKDMIRLDNVKKPVHVVLCGAPLDTTQAVQADYRQISVRTGGSLHTLEDDLDPTRLDRNTWLRVGSRYFHYNTRKDRFQYTYFRQRPKRFLGVLWWEK